MNTINDSEASSASNFIKEIVIEDLKTNKYGGRVHTRFPPEPNGYLHVGHAKSIHLNFGLANEFGGKCNLRFDDTNPTKEDQEYVDAIMADVRWLGFEWDGLFYASDYFGQLYDWAVQLIRDGKAYVCDLTGDDVAKYRGGLEGGKEFRDAIEQSRMHVDRSLVIGQKFEAMQVVVAIARFETEADADKATRA